MIKVPLTQGKFALIDEDDEPLVLPHKWFAQRIRDRWYAGRNFKRETGWGVLHMHRLLSDADIVDHINGDGLDNRRSNLRPANQFQNQQNRGPNKNNKSGFKGVSRSGKTLWQAHIWSDGKHYALGRYATPEEAARVYDEAAREMHGEFAYQNFPEDPKCICDGFMSCCGSIDHCIRIGKDEPHE